MFGKMFRSFAAGGTGAKAIHVLGKTYNLEVSHPEHLAMMRQIAQYRGESLNEHEMAVAFLVRFAYTIKPDHPQARREIEKYIRMSKGAYNRGLVKFDGDMQQLFKAARERFGVEPDNIEAV
jgi:hypothetical protein